MQRDEITEHEITIVIVGTLLWAYDSVHITLVSRIVSGYYVTSR